MYYMQRDRSSFCVIVLRYLFIHVMPVTILFGEIELLAYTVYDNCPAVVNQKQFVQKHNKAENKSHPRQNRHSGKPKYVNRCQGRVNLTFCGHTLAVES